MKKLLIILAFLLVFLFCFDSGKKVSAETKENEITSDILEELDLEGIQKEIDFIDVKDLINRAIIGEELPLNNVIELLFQDVIQDVKSSLYSSISVIVIILVLSLVSIIKPENDGLNEIIFFVGYLAIFYVLVGKVSSFVKITENAVNKTEKTVDVIMPIMLLLMGISGENASVGVFRPFVSVYSTVIVSIVKKVLMPISVAILIISTVSSLSSQIKLEKTKSFLSSTFKWILGLSFSVISIMLTVNGITAVTFDGIAIKLGKYTVSSSVPIVGGYLGAGLEVIIASTLLIKNSIGLVFTVSLVYYALKPIISILIFTLMLNMIGAICESIADSRISSAITAVSTSLGYFIACISAVAMIFIIMSVILIFGGSVLL